MVVVVVVVIAVVVVVVVVELVALGGGSGGNPSLTFLTFLAIMSRSDWLTQLSSAKTRQRVQKVGERRRVDKGDLRPEMKGAGKESEDVTLRDQNTVNVRWREIEDQSTTESGLKWTLIILMGTTRFW
ncbi:hypothetical protein ElyMa_004317900 [Elysia marginata]|uniref:Uncharacterized protein n=1 Tax=Elysia marginata TaxID=1093978 RepID=A0AAV4GYP8_9GAST|nr:hypothetical protein ElyMa_004317900 [Elysia marginata]